MYNLAQKLRVVRSIWMEINMGTRTPQAREAGYKEWLRIFLFITLALPMCLSVFALLGAQLSESVRSIQVLIGMGILLVAGHWSLQVSSRIPHYMWYAVLSFLVAFVIWYVWNIPGREVVAYSLSAVLSGIATFIAWLVLHEQR